MSSVSGVSNNYFSFFFNTSDNNSGYSVNGLGSTSNLLGDYSLIKTGSYKKLLKAYYKTQDAQNGNESGAASAENADSTGTLLNVKTEASSLKDSLDAFKNSKLYEPTGKDEKGNPTYDREGIKKVVKSFVSAYNSYLDTAGKVENVGILKRTLRMVDTSGANANLLNEIGISIGKDNKLTLDEEKLDKAYPSTLSSMFQGYGSYGSMVSQRASESYKLANSAAYANTHAYSYSYKGAYSIMGTSNNKLDKYM